MKKSITIILGAILFAFSHMSFTKVGIGVAIISAGDVKAQFTTVYRPADSAATYPGSWSGRILYTIRDSLSPAGGYFSIMTPNIYFGRYPGSKNDGDPVSFIWTDANGFVKKSPKSALTLPASQITGLSVPVTQTLTGINGLTVTAGANTFTINQKRQDLYTVNTASTGVATFTFPAFSAVPNIQYNPGYGFTNKETCIPNAAPTTTSCSFYVQLRADVLGLLPSYSNVTGREVNIVVTEK